MNLYSIKCLMFTKNNNIKVNCKIDGKINAHSRCNDYCVKKIVTIDYFVLKM